MNTYKYYNYDESLGYHLLQIDWDLFLSLRYTNKPIQLHKRNCSKQTYNGSSWVSHSLRRDAVWNLVQSTKKELGLPRNSFQWFAVTEKNQEWGYHNHVLVKCRKDIALDNHFLLGVMYKYLSENVFEREKMTAGQVLPKSLQVVECNDRVVKYTLKTTNTDESITGIKDMSFYSEKFVKLCARMKITRGKCW